MYTIKTQHLKHLKIPTNLLVPLSKKTALLYPIPKYITAFETFIFIYLFIRLH